MRLLIVTAISMLILIPGAFAQGSSSSPTSNQSDRAAAAKRNLADLERARLLDALRNSTLRMQAQSQELEKLVQQTEPPAAEQSMQPEHSIQDVERQHPEWFEEPNAYKPCPWNRCPSPPPQ